jgi:hypothetical protein
VVSETRALHATYPEIVGMGERVVRRVLRELLVWLQMHVRQDPRKRRQSEESGAPEKKHPQLATLRLPAHEDNRKEQSHRTSEAAGQHDIGPEIQPVTTPFRFLLKSCFLSRIGRDFDEYWCGRLIGTAVPDAQDRPINPRTKLQTVRRRARRDRRASSVCSSTGEALIRAARTACGTRPSAACSPPGSAGTARSCRPTPGRPSAGARCCRSGRRWCRGGPPRCRSCTSCGS